MWRYISEPYLTYHHLQHNIHMLVELNLINYVSILGVEHGTKPTQHHHHHHHQIDFLGFNGTFSTNRLHRVASDKCVAVKK